MMSVVIGIDLGTTFSAVAQIDDTGRPTIIHDQDGNNIIPSCVSEREPGVMEVGEFARRTWSNAPDQAAARFKRDMGTSTKHTINGQEFSPTELSALVLKKLKKIAEASVGQIERCVVTIPANFANEAREATLSAAKIAGLNVEFIINEPTAAALYYAFKSGDELGGNYAVYDLGGGTFDVSIIRVDGHEVEVLSSNGVSKLGGDDFDRAMLELVAEKYRDEFNEDMDSEDFPINEAEEEKKSLSARKRTTARVGRKPIDVSREEFEEAISSWVTQAEMLCESTLEEAGLEPSDLKGVFLAGGSTRIPIIRASVERVFKQEPVSSANVDEVVALGAALYAAYKGDRSTLSAAQKNAIGKIQVSESTGKCFGTIAVSMNDARDEAALMNSILIRKGEKIPCSVTESFRTIYDGQDAVDCQVTESTSPERDPRFVNIIWEGRLALPSGRDAGQEIRITYSYDENQTMKCSFVDVASGKETHVDLAMKTNNSEINDEINRFLVE